MFAHQGGWDEFLYVLAPIVVIVSLLRLANSRAKRLGRQNTPDSHSDSTSDSSSESDSKQ